MFKIAFFQCMKILPEHKTEGITAIRFLSKATRATKLCTAKSIFNNIFVKHASNTAELSSSIRVHSSWKKQKTICYVAFNSAFVLSVLFEYFWIIESLSLDSLIMPPGLRGWRWRVENLIPFPKPPGHVGLDQSQFNANTLSIPGCKAGSA